MGFTEIHIIDAELRGYDGGVHIEDEYGRSLASWPMGLEEAEERAGQWWPGMHIIHYEAERD